MNDQRGYMTIALATLLPLFLVVFAVIAASYFLIKGDALARHRCRTELLKAQAEIATDLRELMALNPEATSLRIQRLTAQQAVIAAAATPGAQAALPAAQANLQRVITLQLALSTKQKALLAKAKLRSQLAPSMSLRSIRSALAAAKALQTDDHQNEAFTGTIQAARFDVVPMPPGSLTPNYQPSAQFQKLQRMNVRWSFSIAAFLPRWIRNLVESSGLKARAECSVTLEKEKTGWEPRIAKDKSSSSF